MADEVISKVRVPDGTSNVYVLKDEISRSRTEYETVTKTGNPLVLESGGQSADSLVLNMEPIQDLHEYDHPWVGGAGKNKLPYPYAMGTTTRNGVTFTPNSDGAITVDGTATATAIFLLINSLVLPAGTYIISGGLSTNARVHVRSGDSTGYDIATSPSNGQFTVDGTESVGVIVRVGSGETITNATFYPMIRLASETDATFEPYSNICPISGHTEADVKVTGKNKLQVTGTTNTINGLTFTVNSDGTVIVTGTASAVTVFTIASYSILATNMILNGCPTGGGPLSYALILNHSGNPYYDSGNGVTIPANTSLSLGSYQIRIASGYSAPSDGLIFKPMLRLSSETVATFEPYTEKNLTQQLGQTVYGGTYNFTTGELVVDRSFVEFDGSSDETIVTYSTRNGFHFAGLDDMASGSFVNGKCNLAKVVDNVTTHGVRYSDYGAYWLYSQDDLGITTVEDLRSYLFETPIQFCYELAAPLTYTLTPQQLETLVGTNIFTSENGTVEVTIRDGVFMLAGEGVDGAEWGKITGTMSDQTDLGNALSAINSDLASAEDEIDSIRTATSTEETDPYLFKSSARENVVGNLMSVHKIIGGTVAWNQLAKSDKATVTANGITFTNNGDGSWTINGTSTGRANAPISINNISIIPSHKFLISGAPSNATNRKNHYALVLYKNNLYVTARYTTGNSIIAIDGIDVDSGYIEIVATDDANVTISNDKFIPQLIDLTQMFGSTIADYIYSLEQATAGAGVAFFRNLFPNDYYDYNAGELISVKTSAHVMRGFNQWDEEWEEGVYSNSDGTKISTTNRLRSKNYLPCLPNTNYYYTYLGNISGLQLRVCYYSKDKTFISSDNDKNLNSVYVTPMNAYYLTFCLIGANISTYNHDICINISKTTGSPKNGDYVPYEKHSYPLDPDLELRGIPKLDSNNNLYYDGDEYEPSGTVTRKYGQKELSVLSWRNATYEGNVYYFAKADSSITSNLQAIYFGYCTAYTQVNIDGLPDNGCIMFSSTYVGGGNAIIVRDDSISSVSDLVTKLTGKGSLIYKLVDNTTETADAYDKQQVFDVTGTEEYVDTRSVPIPVGHDTFFPTSITSRIDALEDEVNEEINKISTFVSVDVTLASSSWDSSTNVYTISNSKVTANSLQVVVPAIGITDTQLRALQNANIQDYGQDAGHLYLKAYGDLPSIDVPVAVIFLPMTSALGA